MVLEINQSPTKMRQAHKRLDFETEVVLSFDAACVHEEDGLETALSNLEKLSYDLEWEPNLGERFIEALLKFDSESGGSQGIVEFVLLQSEFYLSQHVHGLTPIPVAFSASLCG